MSQNLKIIKATNNNVRFVRESFDGVGLVDVTVAVLQEQASLRVSKGKDQIQVRDLTGMEYDFDINTVKETQVEPDPAISFNGDIESLMTTLREQFFF